LAITDALIPEYDHEMGTTRRLLDRVPEAEFSWRPHQKSRSLGELSGHLAQIPHWCRIVLESSSFDLAESVDDTRAKAPPSRSALLKEFDASVSAARGLLVRMTDAELLAQWTLNRADQEILSLPRISAVRSFVMNHSIHHRGQLTVYLRLRDVLLPPIYGPTADEQ
jgi:uncharacterized damage-inducible protein DinB